MVKNIVKIDGMMCGMCEAHVNDAIRKAFPEAQKVSASRKNGEAVFLTDDEINPDKIKSAVEETGYTFVSFDSEPYKKRGIFGKGL